MLRPLIGEDVVLATELDPALGPIEADPGQLHQVVMNLVVNARDAMPDGGALSIETANADVVENGDGAIEPGRYVTLTVRDSGRGDRRGDAAPDLRAVLHDEGRGQGDGARSRDRLRDRQAERRLRRGRERGRRRLRVHDLPAPRDDAGEQPIEPSAAPAPVPAVAPDAAEPRPCSSSRTRRSSAASSCRCSRARATTSLVANDGEEAIALAAAQPRRRAPDRPDDAGARRPRAGRAAARARPGAEGVYMSGYAEGGHLLGRRPAARRPRSSRSRSPSRADRERMRASCSSRA